MKRTRKDSKRIYLRGLAPGQYYTDKMLAAHIKNHSSTIWRWVREGRLPKPEKFGPQTSRWLSDDLMEPT